MRKIVTYFLGFLTIFFIVPVICTVTPKKVEETASTEIINSEKEEKKEPIKQYEYKKYGTINLLHSETNEIEEMSIDEYLYGVVSSEMPVSYELEALKAQAVVARTYTIYQIIHNSNKHDNANICDNYGCCQAWISKQDRFARWEEQDTEKNWNKIIEAVDSTKGKIITYNGEPINAFFHSNSGGITESSLNIWGGIDYPYLKSVETAGEEGYNQYNSQITLTEQELLEKIKSKYSDCVIDFSQTDCIKILEYTTSGRVKTIKLGNKEIAGTEARTILGLKSTNFTFSVEGDKITFSVTGYGHGVGMSQTGADALAKAGSNYETIIKHFYTDVEISEINSL